MIKFLTTLVLALVSHVLLAQTVFDKFDGPEDITTITVNKKMFEMMSKVKSNTTDKETQQYLNLVKKLENLKVFVTSNTKMAADMKATAEKYIKSPGLEELMRVNDGGKSVKIHIRSSANGTKIKELFMFIEGGPKDKETIILLLTGDFDLNEISLLTDKMSLPGGEDLKKASKGKK
ncbi:DUF4252 domain-containing protein [Flavobacterium sp.]|uniref:DUF4252 domain-containing protein n=1 Tax=Flavobacterium sp. TaxID=239 RepID=UPI002FDA366B